MEWKLNAAEHLILNSIGASEASHISAMALALVLFRESVSR